MFNSKRMCWLQIDLNLFGRICSRAGSGGIVAGHVVPGADRVRRRFRFNTVCAYVVVSARAGIQQSAVREFLGSAGYAERRGRLEVALLGRAHHRRYVVHVRRRVRVRLVHLRLQSERVLRRVFVDHLLRLFRVVVARGREVVWPHFLGPRVQGGRWRRVFAFCTQSGDVVLAWSWSGTVIFFVMSCTKTKGWCTSTFGFWY